MKTLMIRVVAAAALVAAPLAVAIGVTPAVGNAIPDCGPGKWFDPNMSICRNNSDVTNPQNCFPNGWWDPIAVTCRPF